MAIIQFKNLPDTSTPLTAENLNNNFNELKTKEYGGITLDDFKNYLINEAPSGTYLMNLNISGAMSSAIVQKANNDYLSFIRFGYGVGATQYQYQNGNWVTIPLG